MYKSNLLESQMLLTRQSTPRVEHPSTARCNYKTITFHDCKTRSTTRQLRFTIAKHVQDTKSETLRALSLSYHLQGDAQLEWFSENRTRRAQSTQHSLSTEQQCDRKNEAPSPSETQHAETITFHYSMLVMQQKRQHNIRDAQECHSECCEVRGANP